MLILNYLNTFMGEFAGVCSILYLAPADAFQRHLQANFNNILPCPVSYKVLAGKVLSMAEL